MNSVKTLLSKRLVVALAILLAINFLLSTLPINEAIAQTTYEVTITGFAFFPKSLTIQQGDTVIWKNMDPVIHILWFVLLADGSTYLLSDPIYPGATWSHTFNDIVSIQYYSFEHLWVTGFLNVQMRVPEGAQWASTHPYKCIY